MANRLTVDSSGELIFSGADIISALDQLTTSAKIQSIEQLDMTGTLIEDGPDSWVYFSDPDFVGDVALKVVAEQDQSILTSNIALAVTAIEEAIEALPIASFIPTLPLQLTANEILSTVDAELNDDAQVHNLTSAQFDINAVDDDLFELIAHDDEQGELHTSGQVDLEITSGGDIVNHRFELQSTSSDGQPLGFGPDQFVRPMHTELRDEIPSGMGGELRNELPDASDTPVPDIEAALDGVTLIEMPSEIIDALSSVDHIAISQLPEGAAINNGIEMAPGEFHLSDHLDSPIQMTLTNAEPGDHSLHFQGLNTIGNPVEGASAQRLLQIDESHQSEQAANIAPMQEMNDDDGASDWTQGPAVDDVVDPFGDTPDQDHGSPLDRGDQPNIDDHLF